MKGILWVDTEVNGKNVRTELVKKDLDLIQEKGMLEAVKTIL